MDKIIVIIGATATGKTNLAIKLANSLNGEIINADAFQVYKEMSIGTARATDIEKKQATFHLDGEISIYDEWNIKKFQTLANEVIDKIISNKKLPIVIGGSLLYIEALVKNYNLNNSKHRTDEYSHMTNEDMHKEISKNNPALAQRIDVCNRKRLLRGMELIKDDEFDINDKNPPKYEPIYIYTYMDRETIYERINKRVELMLDNGWINEVKEILKKDKNADKLNALKAIGYSQIIDSINNSKLLDIEKIKQNTRHYAKRQLTWIKNRLADNIKYIDGEYQKLLSQIEKIIN